MKKLIVPLTFLLAAMTAPIASHAGVFVSINIAPPELPVYEQPEAPDDGYIWTPGYWAYGDEGYYWVPGTWVVAPEPGYLWTPAYWGWADGLYVFHPGYWGTEVGYYGGIDYGYGYGGHGYQGGRWDHGHFFYNRAVNHIDSARFHNTYNHAVANRSTSNRISYNGGDGGTRAHPSHQQLQAEHQHHVEPTAVQTQHEQAARSNPAQFVNQNHGRPEVAATPHAGQFNGPGIAQPKGPSAFTNPKSGQQHEERPAQNQAHAPAYSQQQHAPQQHGAMEHSQPQAVQPRIHEQSEVQQHSQQQFRPQQQQHEQPQFRAQPQQQQHEQPQPRAQPQPQQHEQPQPRAQPQPQMREQHQAAPRPQQMAPQQPRPQAIAPQQHEAPRANGGGGGGGGHQGGGGGGERHDAEHH